MSTKADIWDGNPSQSRIYQETLEPVSVWGKFKGFNTYIEIEWQHLISARMEGEYLTIEVKPHDELPVKWKIWGGHIGYFDIDTDGIDIQIKGGSTVAQCLNEKRYDVLAGVERDHYKRVER